MRGTMLWFNDEKNVGVIVAEDGERLAVHGEEFAPDERPTGRCSGTPVAFSVVDGEERHAAAVTLIAEVASRRARRRHGR